MRCCVVWNPPVMLCPADDENPGEYHSYVLNGHLVEKKVRYFSKNFGGNLTGWTAHLEAVDALQRSGLAAYADRPAASLGSS